jgi:hypothetical protein
LGGELAHSVAHERFELSANPAGERQREPLLRSPDDLVRQRPLERAEQQLRGGQEGPPGLLFLR